MGRVDQGQRWKTLRSFSSAPTDSREGGERSGGAALGCALDLLSESKNGEPGFRQRRAAPFPPAASRMDERVPEKPVQILDEIPGAAIGHAQFLRRRRDRSRIRDRLQQGDLAGADFPPWRKVDADRKARTFPRRNFSRCFRPRHSRFAARAARRLALVAAICRSRSARAASLSPARAKATSSACSRSPRSRPALETAISRRR